jgi:hypothetical protein
MGVLRRSAAVLLCALATTYPGRVSAQSAAPIELKWSALEGCPSAEAVLARVHKIAGTTRATPNTLQADASISQPNDGLFRMRLEIRYGNLVAVRNIEGKSCKDLAGATAVALALLLSSEEPLSERDLAGTSPAQTVPAASTTGGGDQEPAKQATPQKPAATSPPTSEPATPTPTPTASSGEPGHPRGWRVLLVAPLGALSVGPMKQVSLGLGLGAGVAFDRWRFSAEAKLWASQHETIGNVGEYDVELHRFTVGARACRNIFGSRFEFAPCALMSVHHLSMGGSGPSFVPGTDSVTWAAAGIGAQARLLITSWLGLVAAVDGEFQFSRPEVSASLPGPPPPGPLPGSRFPTQVSVPVERLAPAAATLTAGFQWIL